MEHHPHKQGPPHKQHGHKHTDAHVAELIGMIKLNSKGFGFVDIPERDDDIEIAPELLNTALHRDTVKIVLKPGMRFGRMQGEVIEVVARSKTRFVGTLEKEDGFFFVRPDDQRVYMDFILEHGAEVEAALGQKVAVDLVRWSSMKKNPLAKLVEVLGPAGVHETEMRSIVAGQGFDYNFPAEVDKQAEEIEAGKKQFFETEVARRRDFRGTTTFTIDPADAKDFDDAISVREMENGHIELGVHIADVSAYLTPGSPMDLEAQKRATSIYLVDRTIPMLPEALSNDLCSLVPHQDRLAMSAVFEMSREGDVYDMWYGETVINSDRRFSYQEAQEILTAGRGDCFSQLLTADTIARNLREARFRNGSIGFETDEIKFELDSTGKPVRAFRKERIDTMLMIEDLMLLANREVATWVNERIKANKGQGVFVWRIHDSPKVDRIKELSLFLKVLGYDLPNQNGIVTARDINKLFKEIEDAPERDMIETSTIRSMAKAIYSTKNIGHFGLAFDYYTHFTSPIRRYPDVMVHRIVKSYLGGHPIGSKDAPFYVRMCAQSTEREIAAMEAERDSIKLKQCEFLAQHIGEEYDGIINGINDWGMFIEEAGTMAEGLVRTNTMRDDYYELTDHGYRMVGQKKKRTFLLGDKVRVKLKGVDIERKTIDWTLV
jgi:ribonuclease R